jgi:Ca2+:H+ antiporter
MVSAYDKSSGPAGPAWAWLSPLAAVVLALLGLAFSDSGVVSLGMAAALIATVFAAVYHAEVLAHRLGEPFGTLVLAVAVTVIEVALIVSIMIAAPTEKAGLARDTVFAAVMIVCNGMVGISLLAGGVRHRTQDFQLQASSAALAVLAALTVLTLIMPNVTTTTPGPTYSPSQLVFAAVVSLVLYGGYVFVQTVRHRDHFVPVVPESEEDVLVPVPDAPTAQLSFLLLLVSLAAVVLLAKLLSPAIEAGVAAIAAPEAVVGIAIAALVLLPEGLAAYRASRANRLQTSLNLALGSALAGIGLTIPTVVALALALDMPLTLGLGIKDEVLLGLTLLISVITLGTGRTTVLQGIVHLVMFASFLFFAFVP